MSCTTEQIVYVKQPVPEHLLYKCTVPKIDFKTYGGAVVYIEKLFNVIDKCNDDKNALKEILEN